MTPKPSRQETIKRRAKLHVSTVLAGIVTRAIKGTSTTFDELSDPSVKTPEIKTMRLAIIHAAASSGITYYAISKMLNLGYVNATLHVKKCEKMYQASEQFKMIADAIYQNKTN